jgi:hypothetical protein
VRSWKPYAAALSHPDTGHDRPLSCISASPRATTSSRDAKVKDPPCHGGLWQATVICGRPSRLTRTPARAHAHRRHAIICAMCSCSRANDDHRLYFPGARQG